MKGKKHDDEKRPGRASGGGVEEGVKANDKGGNDYYAGGESNVRKEAEERTSKFKKGGKVPAFLRGKMSEGMEKHEEKKKAKKEGGYCEGGMPHKRSDKKPRASGGRVARADGGPLSTASKTSERPDFKGMKNIDD